MNKSVLVYLHYFYIPCSVLVMLITEQKGSLASRILLPVVPPSLLQSGHRQKNCFCISSTQGYNKTKKKFKGKRYCYASSMINKFALDWLKTFFTAFVVSCKKSNILWTLLPYHRCQYLLKDLFMRGEILKNSMIVELLRTCCAPFPLINVTISPPYKP